MTDDRASKGVEHLQAAALEMIAAARAFLDVAEDLVADKDKVADVMAAVGETYQRAVVAFKWEPCEVLLLDNMLTAHGRYPFVGERKIVVAMGEIFNEHSLQVVA